MTNGLERWQGAIEQAMKEVERRTDAHDTEIATIVELLSTIRVELATIRTKVGLWSALGALAGTGVVGAIVALSTGG